jgi:hypothetical protein
VRGTLHAFPASEELVAAAEAKLGRQLSAPHRQRLISNNGGQIRAMSDTWTLFPVWDPSTRKTTATRHPAFPPGGQPVTADRGTYGCRRVRACS